jgi:hypothetical protein
MSSTVRPNNVRAALAAKLAAAMSQLVELREAEQPRLTPHLSPREIVGAFLLYARGVYTIVDTLGKAQAGHLQFNAWYGQWTEGLGDADRALWKQLSDDRGAEEQGRGVALIDHGIAAAADPSSTAQQAAPGARADVRKGLVRFAAYPDRAAGNVCEHYLRLAKRLADDFVRDHARFLP